MTYLVTILAEYCRQHEALSMPFWRGVVRVIAIRFSLISVPGL